MSSILAKVAVIFPENACWEHRVVEHFCVQARTRHACQRFFFWTHLSAHALHSVELCDSLTAPCGAAWALHLLRF